FAICWNGLVYPVKSIGTPADLHTEITNAFKWITLTNTINGTNKVVAMEIFSGRGGWNNAAGESSTVFFTNAFSTRVLLLLRCGETDNALKIWKFSGRAFELRGGIGSINDLTNRPSNDPYLPLASDWTWAMFDRMISAHQRGDEILALATARQLAEVQPEIESE